MTKLPKSIRRSGALASAIVLLLASGCATRGDYEAVYYAEEGDYGAALEAAQRAQGGGIDGLVFGTGAGACRDYNAVVTLLVAKGDFAAARASCANYDRECAVLPDSALCFTYESAELEAATSDASLAESLSATAREQLHFRWLMIRDDYEDRGIRRPIY